MRVTIMNKANLTVITVAWAVLSALVFVTAPSTAVAQAPLVSCFVPLPAGPPMQTIEGTKGNDVIIGTPGDDIIVALGGDDVIDGMGGNDWICAGDGNDTVTGGAGDDWLDGGAGDDIIKGGAGNDLIRGQIGSDMLFGGAGDDNITGHAGADTLSGGKGEDQMDGGPDNDEIRGGGDDDQLNGDDGDDRLIGGGGDDQLEGDNGVDVVLAGKGDDALSGGLGNDDVRGGAGNDRVFGAEGEDMVKGGGGDDIVVGGPDQDALNGGPGVDSCETPENEQPLRCELVESWPTRVVTIDVDGLPPAIDVPLAGVEIEFREIVFQTVEYAEVQLPPPPGETFGVTVATTSCADAQLDPELAGFPCEDKTSQVQRTGIKLASVIYDGGSTITATLPDVSLRLKGATPFSGCGNTIDGTIEAGVTQAEAVVHSVCA